MNKEDAKKWAEIFKTISNGGEIEAYSIQGDYWHDVDVFSFMEDLVPVKLIRVKTEPEYIPFEWKDWNQFMGKSVRRKEKHFKDDIQEIQGFKTNSVLIFDGIGSDWKSFEYMLSEWEFAEGKPFGKLK